MRIIEVNAMLKEEFENRREIAVRTSEMSSNGFVNVEFMDLIYDSTIILFTKEVIPNIDEIKEDQDLKELFWQEYEEVRSTGQDVDVKISDDLTLRFLA